MGLFLKARTIQSKTKSGLLNRSDTLHRQSGGFAISQNEVDALYAAAPGRLKPATDENREIPESVPLTWEDAGMAFPPQKRGPILDQKEVQNLFAPTDEADELRERIFADMGHLQDSLEAPAHLFTLLKNRLVFQQAALLLYDPLRMVYAPWASIGYDETTRHRLRIPLGFSDSFNLVANGDLVLLTEDKDLQAYQRCFSAGDYSSLDQILLLPFIFQNKLISVLLINGMPGLPALDEKTRRLLVEISTRVAPILFRAREEKFNRLQFDNLDSTEAIEAKVSALADQYLSGERSFLVMRLSLENPIQAIVHLNPLIDQFRLKEDMTGLIHSLVSELGKVYTLEQNLILLIIYRMSDADSELLLYHLKKNLQYYFREISEPISFDEELRVITPDGPQVPKVLSELV